MTGKEPTGLKHGLWTTWLTAAALLGAVWAAIPPQMREDGAAKGGSPLYGIVAADAVERLAQTGREAREQAREPCPRCGRVHGRQPQASADADAAAGHAMPASASPSVPRPAGTAAQDPPPKSPQYLYCSQCRIYHSQAAGEEGKTPHP